MQLRVVEATPSEADSSDGGDAAAGGLAAGCCLDFSRVCTLTAVPLTAANKQACSMDLPITAHVYHNNRTHCAGNQTYCSLSTVPARTCTSFAALRRRLKSRCSCWARRRAPSTGAPWPRHGGEALYCSPCCTMQRWRC